MRGNIKVVKRGSIPACTGEPIIRSTRATQTEVYPRVYGGTANQIAQATGDTGLSPRVRGNPRCLRKARPC